jgi:hypothetical protein
VIREHLQGHRADDRRNQPVDEYTDKVSYMDEATQRMYKGTEVPDDERN